MVRPYIEEAGYIKKFRHSRVQKGIYEHENRLYASFNLDILPIEQLLKILINLDDKFYHFDAGFLNQFTYTKIHHPLNKKIYSLLKQLMQKSNIYSFLKLFYDAGILHELFTNFRKVIHLPQFDGYHNYPVDLHSIKCIEALENIKDPIINELFNDLDENEKLLLKVVVLFHDTGKGRKQDHSEVGAKLIVPFVKKIGFNTQLIERAVTLIKNHIVMSNTAFKQNIHNEKTLYKFMSKVKDEKNLKLLYILTYADINGVGGDVYNSFNSKLLYDLYLSALEVSQNSDRITDAKKRLIIEKRVKNNLAYSTLTRILQKKILSVESNLFFFRHTPLDIIKIAQKAKETKDYQFSVHNDKALSIEICRKVPLNVGFLLAILSHLDVGSMEIFTLFDGIKYFKIEFKQNLDGSELVEVQDIIDAAFDMDRKTEIKKVSIKRDEISVDCDHSLTHAEISINTKNQLGLLAYMMDCFEKLEINIVTAKIHSNKHKVRDTFLMDKENDICNNVENIYKLLIGDN